MQSSSTSHLHEHIMRKKSMYILIKNSAALARLQIDVVSHPMYASYVYLLMRS